MDSEREMNSVMERERLTNKPVKQRVLGAHLCSVSRNPSSVTT